MSKPKIVYVVKVFHISQNDGKWFWERGNPLIDISLFYEKEDAENFSRSILIQDLKYYDKNEDKLVEANTLPWKLIEEKIDNWYKNFPFKLNVKIEETEIT